VASNARPQLCTTASEHLTFVSNNPNVMPFHTAFGGLSVSSTNGRRFPPQPAAVSSAATTGAISDANANLYALGKRIERLFFTGLVLTGLAWGEVYLTAANYQVSQDRTSAAVGLLLGKVQANLEKLDRLYQEKIKPVATPRAPTQANLNASIKRLNAIRKSLGLPPVKPVELPKAAPEVSETYEGALNSLVSETAQTSQVELNTLQTYNNANQSPADLTKRLSLDASAAEKRTLVVFGVRTPRLIAIDYNGSNFVFPYEVLAIVLLVILTPLIPGWLSALYITRQREIREIKRATTLSVVFPHVLNFLPLFIRPSPAIKAQAEQVAVLVVIFQALVRVTIMLVVIVPVLVGYFGSIAQFSKFSTPSNFIWFFAAYMLLQSFWLILQEAFRFGTKVFWEEPSAP
jgi:hypothetical protein